jgi:hypothetical protein
MGPQYIKLRSDAERLGERCNGGLNRQISQRGLNRIAFHSQKRVSVTVLRFAHRGVSMRKLMRPHDRMSVIFPPPSPSKAVKKSPLCCRHFDPADHRSIVPFQSQRVALSRARSGSFFFARDDVSFSIDTDGIKNQVVLPEGLWAHRAV